MLLPFLSVILDFIIHNYRKTLKCRVTCDENESEPQAGKKIKQITGFNGRRKETGQTGQSPSNSIVGKADHGQIQAMGQSSLQVTRAMRRRQGKVQNRQKLKPGDQSAGLENRKVEHLETGTETGGLKQGLDKAGKAGRRLELDWNGDR